MFYQCSVKCLVRDTCVSQAVPDIFNKTKQTKTQLNSSTDSWKPGNKFNYIANKQTGNSIKLVSLHLFFLTVHYLFGFKLFPLLLLVFAWFLKRHFSCKRLESILRASKVYLTTCVQSISNKHIRRTSVSIQHQQKMDLI